MVTDSWGPSWSSISSLLLLISTLTSSLMSLGSSQEVLESPLDSSKDFSRLLISGSTPLLFRDFGFFCFLLERSSRTAAVSEVSGETELEEEEEGLMLNMLGSWMESRERAEENYFYNTTD